MTTWHANDSLDQLLPDEHFGDVEAFYALVFADTDWAARVHALLARPADLFAAF